MAFSIEDYQDLMEVLRQHPEWTAQLRELLVGKQLDEANERLARIEATLDRVDAQIAEQGRQIAEQGRQIAEQGRQIALIAERLESSLLRIDARLGTVEGWRTEQRWITHGRSWLSRVVQDATLVGVPDLLALKGAMLDGRIGTSEYDEVGLADALFRGLTDDGAEVVAVIEASKTIDLHDIDRADNRARILRRAGYRAMGIVAGESIRTEDRERAAARGLGVYLGGRIESLPASPA